MTPPPQEPVWQDATKFKKAAPTTPPAKAPLADTSVLAPNPETPAGGLTVTDLDLGGGASMVPASGFRRPPTLQGPRTPLPPDEGMWKYVPDALKIGTMILVSRAAPGLAMRMAGGAELGAAGTATAQVIGAGVGGGGAELLHGAGQAIFDDPNAPPNVGAMMDRAAQMSSQGVTGELMGPPIVAGTRVLTAPIRAIGSRIKGALFPPPTVGGQEALDYLGGAVTAGQVRDSPFLNMVEGWIGSSIGGGRIRRQVEEGARRLAQRANTLMHEFGLDPSDIASPQRAGEVITDRMAAPLERQAVHTGRLGQANQQVASNIRGELGREASSIPGAERRGQFIQDVTELAHGEARDLGNQLYAEVDQVAGDVRVKLDPLAEFVRKEAERRGALGQALAPGSVKSTMRNVNSALKPPNALGPGMDEAAEALGVDPSKLLQDPAYGALLKALGDAGIEAGELEAGAITFGQAHRARSALGRILRDAERSGNSDLKGVASQLRERLDKSMTEAAGGPDSPLRIAYDQATNHWRRMSETFEEGILAEIAGKDARLVTDHILQPGREEALKRVFAQTGPSGQRVIRAAALDKLLKNESGDWVTGKELGNRILALNKGEGGSTVKILFGKQGQVRLADLERVMTAADDYGTRSKDLLGEAAKIKGTAQQAFQTLLKPGNVEAISAARQMLGEDWKVIQGTHLTNLLENKKGMFDALHKLGAETVEAIYGRSGSAGLFQFARVAKQIADRTPEKSSWPIRVQLGMGAASTAGALSGGLSLGAAARAGAGIILSPLMLGRILANPQARSTLFVAMKEPATKVGQQAAGQLGAYLLREGLIPRSEAGLVGPPPRVEGPGPSTGGPPSVGGRAGGPGPLGGPPQVRPPR